MPDAGVYMCVRAYGAAPSTYSMRAVYTMCPADFTEAGEQLICSSPVNAPDSQKRYTSCSSDGLCNCKGQYAKPLPEVYDGMTSPLKLCLTATVLALSCQPKCVSSSSLAAPQDVTQLPVHVWCTSSLPPDMLT